MDFMTTYKAQNSWAIVTGASEGIGLGFVEQLALLGFNVILISRTESKLVAKVKELKQKYPNRDFNYIAKDFTQGSSLSFYQEIFDFCKKLDVSLLVNNVGGSFDKSLCKETYENV